MEIVINVDVTLNSNSPYPRTISSGENGELIH